MLEPPSFPCVHPGGDPYDVSDAEGGSSHHPSTYHDEDYPRASPPQSPFEDEGYVGLHIWLQTLWHTHAHPSIHTTHTQRSH